MNYNIQGKNAVPWDVSAHALTVVYDVCGNAQPLNVILDENFGTFNTDVWSCVTGPYRDWQYLPADYSNNVLSKDNQLIVRNLKNDPTPEYEWSGAWIDTKNKVEFQYGTIVARIKFPSNDYYHATLWLLGHNSGEIDIVETDAGRAWCVLHFYDDTTTLNHHSQYIGHYPFAASQAGEPTEVDEYHIYQFDWTADKIAVHYDNKLLGTFDVQSASINGYNSFRQPLYLVFNTNPLSPNIDGGKYTDADAVTNYIDFIKVYGLQN